VKTGVYKGGRVEILDGLAPGDHVVTRGHTALIDGSVVAVRSAGGSAAPPDVARGTAPAPPPRRARQDAPPHLPLPPPRATWEAGRGGRGGWVEGPARVGRALVPADGVPERHGDRHARGCEPGSDGGGRHRRPRGEPEHDRRRARAALDVTDRCLPDLRRV